MNKLTNIKHYSKAHVKALYGRYGRESGLNPGVAWPRKEELEHIKQYEAAFCPPLDKMVAENESQKREALEARAARELEVYERLQKLPQEFKSFFEKVETRQEEQQRWTQEREAKIEEVRELLGFKASPNDERFIAAMQQKEEQEIQERKKIHKKARANQALTDLLSLLKPDQTAEDAKKPKN